MNIDMRGFSWVIIGVQADSTLELLRELAYHPHPVVFQTSYFFRANFSETLPCTSWLLTSTAVRAHISKQFAPTWICIEKSEQPSGGVYHPLWLDRNDIPTAILCFRGQGYLTVLLEIPCDVTGSQKSKVVASNMEIRISRRVDMIATQFKRLYECFQGPESNTTTRNTMKPNQKLKIQYAGLPTESTYLSL